MLGLPLLFVGVCFLYAVSMPRTVVLEDDGLFITTATFASVAHQPGYPLYILLGWFASLMPFGSVAWRVHMLSGLMGALTCVCIAWIILRRTGNRPAAYLAGAALAVSEHFWSQSMIADVYTTNSAVVFLTLALLQEAAAKQSTRLWLSAAGVYGLGLANHYPLLILGSPIFLVYIIGAKRDFWSRAYYLIPAAILPAALLYGWMVWRSHQPLPINFLGPIQSWEEFFSFVNRGIYAKFDVDVNAGLVDKLLHARHFATQALLQFSVIGCLVALWGAYTSYRSGWRLELWGEIFAFVASSFLLIALLDFNYEPLMVAVFRPYPLVAYGILALWLGYGLHMLRLNRHERIWQATCATAALVVLILGIYNGKNNYRPHDTFARDQAQAILDFIEDNAVFVLFGDAYAGSIAYLHWVEGQRPDLRMLQAHGLFINDRVVHSAWTEQRQNQAWAKFLRDTDQPVYFLWYGPAFSAVGRVNLGFLSKTDKEVQPGRVLVGPNDLAKEYFKQLITMPQPTDAWFSSHRNQMLKTYGEYLGMVQAINRLGVSDYLKDILPLAENNYWSLMGMAEVLAQQDGDRSLQTAEDFLQQAKQISPDDLSKVQRASVFFVEALIERRKGNLQKAISLLRKSLRINRKRSNPAYLVLGELGVPG